MKKSRLGAAVAVAAAGALALAGCTASGGGNSSAPTGGTVSIAIVNDLTSLNNNTPQGNLDTNGQYTYLTGASFSYPDNNFNLVQNTDVGTIEKTSDSPLTVTMKLNDKLKWSDGEPVTADDLVLNWAINSGYYDDATLDADGKATSGTQYFAIAGSTAGLDKDVVPDDQQRQQVDHADVLGALRRLEPARERHERHRAARAHRREEGGPVLGRRPHGAAEEPAQGQPGRPGRAQREAAGRGRLRELGYDITSFPTDPDLLVAAGPWQLSAWTPGQSLEFSKNPQYTGSLTPRSTRSSCASFRMRPLR